MILPFSTNINGKETFFVQKIWGSLKSKCNLKDFIDETPTKFFASFEVSKNLKPKLHTIREDKNDRWKIGTLIHFYINARQKNMFRFAPVLPVVSIQKIEIKMIGFSDGFRPWVKIDDKLFYDVAEKLKPQMLQFAQNDGFDTIEDFFNYFDKDYLGKIIHWTDLKY